MGFWGFLLRLRPRLVTTEDFQGVFGVPDLDAIHDLGGGKIVAFGSQLVPEKEGLGGFQAVGLKETTDAVGLVDSLGGNVDGTGPADPHGIFVAEAFPEENKPPFAP